MPRVLTTFCGHAVAGCIRAREEYVRALGGAGLDVLAVDPTDHPPDTFDAICLTGGGDVAPSRYGGTDVPELDEVDAARDELEIHLVHLAVERGIPLLGICRGFQVANITLGGRLVPHLSGHSPDFGPLVPHSAVAAPGSRLASACGTAPHLVNTSHHQAVTDETLAPDLRATVRIDGLVEAFELPDHPWFVAVQWHPERIAQVSPEATQIFPAFAAATRVPAR